MNRMSRRNKVLQPVIKKYIQVNCEIKIKTKNKDKRLQFFPLISSAKHVVTQGEMY